MQFPVCVIKQIQYGPQYWHTGIKKAEILFVAKKQAHTLYEELFPASLLHMHFVFLFILKLLTRVLIILGKASNVLRLQTEAEIGSMVIKQIG